MRRRRDWRLKGIVVTYPIVPLRKVCNESLADGADRTIANEADDPGDLV